MKVRTAKAVGAAIKQRRKQLALDQLSFAKSIGASRQWVIGVEQGKDSAEIGRVLRALEALGLAVEISNIVTPSARANVIPQIDINAIVARSKRPTVSIAKSATQRGKKR